MLYKTSNVILPHTLALLSKLQEDTVLNDFFLVGGTALALQIGHRFSVDLDLFTEHSFQTQTLLDHLNTTYQFDLKNLAPNTLMGLIEGVKVDFITHAYPLVEPLLREGHLRLAKAQDIAAMKLNAIAHSGQRMKDFYDIYFLLESMSVSAMLEVYKSKYPNSNALIALKGLTYFEDIDEDMDKPMLNRKVSVKQVKKRLEEAVLNPDRLFKANP